jgi:hypothetical protein
VTNTNTVLVPVGPVVAPPPVMGAPVVPVPVPVPVIKFGKSHPPQKTTTPGPDAKQHHSFFHFLKKDKKDKKDKNAATNN